MANKGPGGNTSGEFPETESFVPGARKRIGTIGGNDLFMKRSAKISAETNWKFKWVGNAHSPRQYGSDREGFAWGIHTPYRRELGSRL